LDVKKRINIYYHFHYNPKLCTLNDFGPGLSSRVNMILIDYPSPPVPSLTTHSVSRCRLASMCSDGGVWQRVGSLCYQAIQVSRHTGHCMFEATFRSEILQTKQSFAHIGRHMHSRCRPGTRGSQVRCQAITTSNKTSKGPTRQVSIMLACLPCL
jgi:hypothetical protein